MTHSEQSRKWTASMDLWMILAAVAIATLLIVIATEAQTQTFTVLHTFTGGADGGSPYAGLTQDSAGNFYGTTAYGSHVGSTCPYGCGVVFKISHIGEGWVLNPIYTFQGGDDGANPLAAVVIASDGSLYGTTSAGGEGSCSNEFGGEGCGTVFRLQPQPHACASFQCPWIETVLYRFTGAADGATPGYGNLLFDQAGNIYGAATYGGLNRENCPTGCGVVYELTHSSQGWTENVLYSFTAGNDGENPFSGLIFDSAGNLYGTNFSNTAYELIPSQSGWSEQTLTRDLFEPYGGVVFDSVGNLYGGDLFGGEGGGSVYQLTPGSSGWMYHLLFSFNYGSGPADSLYSIPAATSMALQRSTLTRARSSSCRRRTADGTSTTFTYSIPTTAPFRSARSYATATATFSAPLRRALTTMESATASLAVG